MISLRRVVDWLARQADDDRHHDHARWLFLRGLSIVLVAAFGSLAFQIRGLAGPNGIAPANAHLASVHDRLGLLAYAARPTLLWIRADDFALLFLVASGLVAALLVFVNVWPRAALVVSVVMLASFTNAVPSFSRADTLDGFLLECAIVGAIWAPPGMRPGLGAHLAPPKTARILLLWLWFRLYFEAGVAKVASGDWLGSDAMRDYFETTPSPTWIGWHAHHLPQGVHVAFAIFTLLVEIPLPIVALVYARARPIAFVGTTLLQVGIGVTANFAYLNWLAIVLGVVLLDDTVFRNSKVTIAPGPRSTSPPRRRFLHAGFAAMVIYASVIPYMSQGWMAYPARVLARVGLANHFELFALIPRAHWEVEIQGSRDGQSWTPYAFRYKPQDVDAPPHIVAPYNPRLESNLWFCAFTNVWSDCVIGPGIAHALLEGDAHVLALFRSDPFGGRPPRFVRFVRYRYSFTTPAERRATGAWWRRELLGAYGPRFERG